MSSVHSDTKNKNVKQLEQYKAYYSKVDVAIISAMTEELEFFQEKFSGYNKQQVTVKGITFDVYNYNNVKTLIACTGLVQHLQLLCSLSLILTFTLIMFYYQEAQVE